MSFERSLILKLTELSKVTFVEFYKNQMKLLTYCFKKMLLTIKNFKEHFSKEHFSIDAEEVMTLPTLSLNPTEENYSITFAYLIKDAINLRVKSQNQALEKSSSICEGLIYSIYNFIELVNTNQNTSPLLEVHEENFSSVLEIIKDLSSKIYIPSQINVSQLAKNIKNFENYVNQAILKLTELSKVTFVEFYKNQMKLLTYCFKKMLLTIKNFKEHFSIDFSPIEPDVFLEENDFSFGK